MVCKFSCSFPVAFADSFEKVFDDLMTDPSVLQRGYARGFEADQVEIAREAKRGFELSRLPCSFEIWHDVGYP